MDNDVSPMLAPVVALVIWTLIVQLGLSGTSLKRGVIEDQVQSKGHNHNHLVEQPTLFYAIAITMALLHGHGESVTNFVLAWAYVFLRMAHSLVKATENLAFYRSVLSNLGSIALLGLAMHAAIHAF